MKILFIASNPSRTSPDNSALHPWTRSRKILNSWISHLDIQPVFANVCDYKTEGNRKLTNEDLYNNLTRLEVKIADAMPDHIVALGDTASRALKLIGMPHTRIDHPSGLNRKLNDPNHVRLIISTLHKISIGIIR